MEVVSNVYPFLPKLTVNGQFIRDFMAEESPCFALGLVEERKQLCGASRRSTRPHSYDSLGSMPRQ